MQHSIKITILAASLLLGGCATNDYKLYADGQAKVEQARYAAEAAKYKAMADIAASGDASAKVAAVVALAMGGGSGSSQQAATLKAPESVSSQLMQWTGLLMPTIVQAYGIRANTQMGLRQSDNAAAVAQSTNAAFVGIAGKIQAPAANVTTTSTTTDSHNVATTTTLSGTGTLGGGSYATAANPTTTTLSGTGTLGGGSYATTANPTTTTTLSGTGTLGSGSYATTANPTTTLSGTGTLGGGAYSTVDTHAVTTTSTDNHAVDTHAVATTTTTDTHATTDNHTTNPAITTTVPAGKVCTVDGTGVLTCI